jgi:hypothetical protein
VADDPSRVLTNKIEVQASERFDVVLTTTAARSDLRLVANPTITKGRASFPSGTRNFSPPSFERFPLGPAGGTRARAAGPAGH